MAHPAVATTSIQGERQVLPEFAWSEIHEPGAYVERETGDLFRIPKEAIVPGASPMVTKETRLVTRFAQISKNPFCTLLEARLRCAQNNIEPNF